MGEGRFELVVIGGGIVGLATAMAASRRFPGRPLLVLEKEPALSRHQTGRNSGVVHTGLYYRPGSQKARLCVEGGRLLREFCEARGIPCVACGKVVVAGDATEATALETLRARGTANGVEGLRLMGPGELREREPCASGVAALLVPGTAITDYTRVAAGFAEEIGRTGGEVRTGARVTALRRDGSATVVETVAGAFKARLVVNCAGLWSDAIARLDGLDPGIRIVPFRGEYHTLGPEAAARVRGLIYPVPDPRFPFLGVHLTRRVSGEVEAGPNAVLALAREGYRWSDVSLRDLAGCLAYPGFARLVSRHWRSGLREIARSLSRRVFLDDLRRLAPDLRLRDLRPGGSGVRAQAVATDGTLLDDFHFVRGPGRVHVLNVPSPAATASIAIGRHIVTLLDSLL